MYARVITLTGVKDVDAAVAYLKETSLSVVRSQRGYKGITASADRSAGLVGILSMWETAADRDASNSALAKVREEARSQLADDMKVETFEERVLHVNRPPTVGSRLRVTRFSADPGKIDELVEYFKQEIVPQVESVPGFRALRNLVNPETGEGVVGTVWDDEQGLQAAEAAVQKLRPEVAARGVTLGETSIREIVFTDIP